MRLLQKIKNFINSIISVERTVPEVASSQNAEIPSMQEIESDSKDFDVNILEANYSGQCIDDGGEKAPSACLEEDIPPYESSVIFDDTRDEPQASPVITSQYMKALSALDEGQNVFIEGGAGTGKSTFIRELRKRHIEKYGNDEGFIVLTPTGVSAIIAEGQTIHSFFRFFPQSEAACATLDCPCTAFPDAQKARNGFDCLLPPWLYKSEKARNARIKLIVIDEISMVRSDMFDSLVCYLKHYGPHLQKFKGGLGVQLCIVGDMQQLPPILRREFSERYCRFYSGVNILHAKTFTSLEFTRVEFTQNFRQKDNTLKEVLEKIRTNKVTTNYIALLNQGVSRTPDIFDDTLFLTSTRKVADNLNIRHLAYFSSPARMYDATYWHKNSKFDYSLYRAPQKLVVKVGVRVMMVANNLPLWANGMLGTVRGLSDDCISVQLDGYDNVLDIYRKTWRDTRYSDAGTKDLVLGEYTQFPLMLGKAVTIHKAQGLSVDTVFIDLSAAMFEKGQLYVALSRCRRLEGLSLSRALTKGDFL